MVKSFLLVPALALSLSFSGVAFAAPVSSDDADGTSVTTQTTSGVAKSGGNPVNVAGTDAAQGSSSAGSSGVISAVSSGRAVPRVMITAFTTEPAAIIAGESFDVSFTLENKSKTERISNLKVTVVSAAEGILPQTGSSSIYIDSIKAGGSVSRKLSFRTLASLEGKPYQLTVRLEYEDSQFLMLSSEEVVSVVVDQVNRAAVSVPQVAPSTLAVGQEGSVTFSVNNLGKNILYNTRVSLKEGQQVQSPSVFIGNIQAGSSGNVEMLVSAKSEYSGPVQATVTYENASGKPETMDVSFEVSFREAPSPSAPPLDEEIKETSSPFSGAVSLVAVGVLGILAVVTVIVVRRRKKKIAEAEDISFLKEENFISNER